MSQLYQFDKSSSSKEKTLVKSKAAKARWQSHKVKQKFKKNRIFNATQTRQTIKEAIIPKPNPLTMRQEIEILKQENDFLKQENDCHLVENE